MNLKLIALSCLFLSSQISYLYGSVAPIVILFGFFLCLLLLLSGNIKSKYTLGEWFGLFLYSSMLALSVALFFWGEYGPFPPRTLYLTAIVQFLIFILLLNLNDSEINGAKNIVLISLLIELFVVLGQFSFVSYGFGFEQKNEIDFIGIGGTMHNPNNTSVSIASMFFAVYIWSVTVKKHGTLYWAITLLTCFGVFYTLSRTAFYFLLVFLLVAVVNKYYVASFKKRLLMVFIVGVMAFLCTSYFVYLNGVVSQGSNELVGRSYDRIFSVVNIDSDDSVAFRLVSYVRLLDNIFNLGIGSFSDLNYFVFFEHGDDPLAKVNPHAFIPEYSFLFGYMGLFVSVGLVLYHSTVVFLNKNVDVLFRLVCIMAIIFFQSVPSSILVNPIFFAPFFLISKVRK